MKRIGCYKIDDNLFIKIKNIFDAYIVDYIDIINNDISCDILLIPEISLENRTRKILYDKNIPIVRVKDKNGIDSTILVFNDEYIEYEEIYKGKFATTLLTNSMLSKMRIEEFINKKISLSFNDFPDELSIEDVIDTLKFMSYEIECINNCDIGHSMRVAKYASMLAESLGLNKEEIRKIYVAGLLHDIGKFRVPNAIFLNDKKITNKQMDIMKNHPTYAYNMLQHPMYKDIKEIILKHHERCDSSGYYKTKEENIPYESKILAIADSYDAMKSRRTYSGPMSNTRIIKEFIISSGKYDEFMLETFIKNIVLN